MIINIALQFDGNHFLIIMRHWKNSAFLWLVLSFIKLATAKRSY